MNPFAGRRFSESELVRSSTPPHGLHLQGSRLFVEVYLNARSWENDEAETQHITEVKAQIVHFLGGTNDTPNDIEPPFSSSSSTIMKTLKATPPHCSSGAVL